MNLLVNSRYPKLSVVPQSLGHGVMYDSLDISCVNPMVSEGCENFFSSKFSPNIAFLDHQETVETDDSHHASDESPVQNEDESETNYLFSFEVDANGLPRSLLDQEDEAPMDFDWLDLLGPTTDPVDLNEIDVVPLPSPHLSSTSVKQSKVNLNIPEKTSSPSVKIDVQTSPSRTTVSSVKRKHPQPSCEPDLISHVHSKQLNVTCKLKLEDDNVDIPLYGARNSSAERCLNNEDLVNGKPGQRLCLSPEERKMLHSMGVRLPSRFPLTRAEEKALRAVRRKIRNKLSAQASRIRRQEYVVDLEHRMQLSNKENQRLKRHIETLENDKRDLLSHIRKLRSYISKVLNRQDQPTPLPLFVKSRTTMKSASQAATAAAGGTSLLIVTFMILAWTAMVPFPSQGFFQLGSLSKVVEPKGADSFFPGRSRTLLQSKPIENVALEENATQDERLLDASISPHTSHGRQPLKEYDSPAATAVNHSADSVPPQIDTDSQHLPSEMNLDSRSKPAVLSVVATMDL